MPEVIVTNSVAVAGAAALLTKLPQVVLGSASRLQCLQPWRLMHNHCDAKLTAIGFQIANMGISALTLCNFEQAACATQAQCFVQLTTDQLFDVQMRLGHGSIFSLSHTSGLCVGWLNSKTGRCNMAAYQKLLLSSPQILQLAPLSEPCRAPLSLPCSSCENRKSMLPLLRTPPNAMHAVRLEVHLYKRFQLYNATVSMLCVMLRFSGDV